MPEGSCNRFLYFVLLLLSEQTHFYLVRLILLFTFTASATAAQQIAKINPKIIIILILSLIFNRYPYCVFLCFPSLPLFITLPEGSRLLIEADFVVDLYQFSYRCTTNRKNKTENNHNVTLSFFNSYFVIPNYASLSCLSATVSHASSAASSFISDAKVVLFVFAHKY